MSRQFLLLLCSSLCAVATIGCSDVELPESSPVLPADEATVERVWGADSDLIEIAEHSFYSQGFSYFGPGFPGWRSVSGAGRNGVWSDGLILPTNDATDTEHRMGSWINGRAGSLRLPFFESADAEPRLQFWFFGIMPGQAVSVFLDGVNVDTIDLSIGWGQYSLALPALASGEHRLRFWFRKTMRHQSKRTPGAMGQIRLGSGPKGTAWPVLDAVETLRSLPSLDGTSWSYYLADVSGAQIQAKLVTQASSAKAELSVTNDQGERTVLSSVKAQAHSELILSGEVPDSIEGAYCVKLTTSSHDGTVHWRTVTLRRRPSTQPVSFPALNPKRLVVVVLDDVTEAQLRLSRKGAYPLTPTMDWLGRSAYTVPHVFTGGDTLRQRVHTFISWSTKLTQGSANRFRSAFFSEVTIRLEDSLRNQIDRDVTWSADRFTQLLDELGLWIKLGGDQSFTATIVLSGQPSSRQMSTPVALGQKLATQEAPRLSDDRARRTTHLDQKLGRLLGLLSYLNDLEDTLLIVMGQKELLGHALDAIKPDHFFSPMLVWYSGEDRHRLRTIMTPLNRVLGGLERSISGDGAGEDSPRWQASVSQLAQPLTTVHSGNLLLVLQDAKRYGLFLFDDGWNALKQSKPITQRAMRVLVDQQ